MSELRTLASLREGKKLTQRELAKQINISYGSIAMYETGKRNPPLKTALSIARFFDVQVEYILFSTINSNTEGVKE